MYSPDFTDFLEMIDSSRVHLRSLCKLWMNSRYGLARNCLESMRRLLLEDLFSRGCCLCLVNFYCSLYYDFQ
jgi:hypothetical protein